MDKKRQKTKKVVRFRKVIVSPSPSLEESESDRGYRSKIGRKFKPAKKDISSSESDDDAVDFRAKSFNAIKNSVIPTKRYR